MTTQTPRRTQYLYLILGEQGGWPGSPQYLAEPVLVVLLEQAALESPQPEGVVHLKRNFRQAKYVRFSHNHFVAFHFVEPEKPRPRALISPTV